MLVPSEGGATLPNCGKPLKLQIPSQKMKVLVARLIASGMVITLKMLQWAIRSQAPTFLLNMEKVQRLNESG